LAPDFFTGKHHTLGLFFVIFLPLVSVPAAAQGPSRIAAQESSVICLVRVACLLT
jgi:hypothetical protein